MNSNKKVAVIITAAGNSTRMGGSVKKEYLSLGDGTVLSKCVSAFVNAANNPENGFILSHLIITVPEDGSSGAADALSSFFVFDSNIQDKVQYVKGGETRQISVFNAMQKLASENNKPDIVLIHDGARPFVSMRIIQDVINYTIQIGAAVPVIPVVDTVKQITVDGFISQHLPRKTLVAIQTPQGFDFSRLMYAHTQASTDGKTYTDDSEIFGKYCGNVKIIPGDIKNLKITYPGDLERGLNL